MGARSRIALLLAVTAAAGGASASAQAPALAAHDVPRLVAEARSGDAAATARLAAWLTAARAGDPGAVSLAATVVGDGITAHADLVAAVNRDAAERGYDARTGFLDAVVAGTASVSTAQAALLVARTAGMPVVDAATTLTSALNADVSQYVVAARFSDPQVDPDDLVVDQVPLTDQASVASTFSKTVCKYVDYYEPVLEFTVMGMEVCTSWRYDKVRYVSHGSRTITPYITIFGTARGWRWLGANVAVSQYFNYARKGAKSGYHTRTVGHFQRCPLPQDDLLCDQDKFPHIKINGFYNGGSSFEATP